VSGCCGIDPQSRLVLLQDKELGRARGHGEAAAPWPRSWRRACASTVGRLRGGRGHGAHKTGFFADQRDNRWLVRQLAKGRSVLDLCCNSGGFAMNAAVGGAAKVRGCGPRRGDGRADLAQTRHANKVKITAVHGDAFDLLRDAQQGAHDLIVLDPPKWVQSP
jgi:predicted methyltransferase